MKWRKKLQNFLADGEIPPPALSGATPETAALMLLKLVKSVSDPLAVTLPDAQTADRMLAALQGFMEMLGCSVSVLSVPECGRGKLLFPGGEARRARALNRILDERFDLIVGSVHAMLGPAPDPEESADSQLELRVGMVIKPAELLEKLVRLDYDDEAMVSISGEFSRRGGIVDVFSPAHDEPCRIEFIGDEIDSMRFFSPESQRSTGSAECYRIINRAGITAGGAAQSDAFAYLERAGNFVMADILPEAGMEILTRYSVPGAPERWRELAEKRRRFVFAEALSDAPDFPVTLPFAADAGTLPEVLRPAERELRRQLLIRRIADHDGVTVLTVANAEDMPRLREWSREAGLPETCEFAVAPSVPGFCAAGVLLLTDRELAPAGFTLASREEAEAAPAEEETAVPPEPVAAAEIEEFSLTDFDEGDYVVHTDYGIGIYRGLKIQRTNGMAREVMALEFRDGQLLYVSPIHAARVSRYLGSPGRVKLHALNSAKWQKDKATARAGVRLYAAEMLRFQAVRQAVPGISFKADAGAVAAFRRAFPFKDTPCQVRSTVEIRRDMLKPKPMDRLLCGDVGYGKTEIAMRAAFRAVSAGYQVAVIAPTTVLAQQHYRSFCERFREFPYTVDVVSRFRTAEEQRTIAEKLRTGGIDILIGTHRLCGNAFTFRNLGLVVIDEEQRFGVEQKERLRRFRVEADVLSMSATPIPRTLYLAMSGARDLSTLTTPPKFRLPVKTVIAPQEDDLIAAAIRAELARGGQVYYLHNRVATIDDCAEHLRELLPDARIAAAHGQMPEAVLEEVMTDFLEGRVDCLVCSTIIESGLDVPNANTIIIERADRFGLAQLYQLRGRVGRWKNQAYAYMLLPRNQLAGTAARKRLAAIRRCSSLGAGFQLALHDLELRGAGNLLGAEQSGHLCMIGFDLYCQLLQREIARMRDLASPQEVLNSPADVEVSIEFLQPALSAPPGILPAALPADYIENENLRLAAYRRMFGIASETKLEDYRDELRDRFGPLPETAVNLLELARCRLLVAAAKCRKLTVAAGVVSLQGVDGRLRRVNGLLPRLDPRDSVKLRLLRLRNFLRDSVPSA